ncbi:hypothetical protein TRFO_30371 [Tritrichomonas foetus]|uniref:Microbial-type PARG catalytic domain-containing protein n=1 Tax=Tritrichomonas foetus TaxID=1144522 RepID=A0A1J4JYB5_9EUKA|nr:hypothetical protein TRFO_30371 [Tritrichomonas foetus]|eukprot:OHT02486.1 hypothetical protein TRFO_30371 [Tritrichomonas foetus]
MYCGALETKKRHHLESRSKYSTKNETKTDLLRIEDLDDVNYSEDLDDHFRRGRNSAPHSSRYNPTNQYNSAQNRTEHISRGPITMNTFTERIHRKVQKSMMKRKEGINVYNSAEAPPRKQLYDTNLNIPNKPVKSISIYSGFNDEKHQRSYHSPIDPSTEEGRKWIARKTRGIQKLRCYVSPLGRDVDLDNDIASCMRETELISPETNYYLRPKIKQSFRNISVVNDQMFKAASNLINKGNIRRVCAINASHPTKPCGNWLTGDYSHECILSRQSALFASVSQNRCDKMFKSHKFDNLDHLYSDHMIYSPNVPVIRDSDEKMLEFPFNVTIISTTPPDMYESRCPSKMVYEVLERRIRKAIQLAYQKRHDGIILDAFGCDIYGNDPEVVCEIYKKLLIDENLCAYFKKVVFAIPEKKVFLIYRIAF